MDIKTDIYQILDLASRFEDDGYGQYTYIFESSTTMVYLYYGIYDGDASIEVYLPQQPQAIIQLNLQRCLEIKVINDKRGKYLECMAFLKGEPLYLPDAKAVKAGFRLRLEPFLNVEPFIINDE